VTGVSTHVLDTSVGRPAVGVAVRLETADGDELGRGVTDEDGRWSTRLERPPTTGGFRVHFSTGDYFGGQAFHSHVTVDFVIRDPRENHHVPLLLSPYGYTTYRGT
jgi:5-hydroxyisourate hydrolase